MEALDVLPPGWQVTTLKPNPSKPLPNLHKAIEATIAWPLDCLPLRDLARRCTNVCVVFTDSTRACPDHLLVPPMLQEITAAGVSPKNITLLCATGMHRPSTFEEKIAKLGIEVALMYSIHDHQAQNPDMLNDLGLIGRPQIDLPIDVPMRVNRIAAEADLLLATGVVEPHQYAGYSGGGKTVAVGCGGEATIASTHGPAFLDDPRVRLGQVDGNPFQRAMREGARRAGLKFVINVVLDQDRHVIAVQAGAPNAVHDRLVTFAKTIYEVPIPQPYDVVIAGVDSPKDVNLYQATRAATYIGLTPKPVVREGGVIILPARCAEGAGEGPGERRFYEALAKANDLNQLLDDLRQRGVQAGEQRAYMLAQVLLKNTILVVGSVHPHLVRDCKMTPAETMEEAISIARGIIGDKALALVVPHAFQTLPMVSGQ